MIRWCAPLLLVFAALLTATIRVGRHKPPRAVPPVAADPDDAEPPVAPAARYADPPPHAAPQPTPTPKRGRTALAQLHGRVLFPPEGGEPRGLGTIEVGADDGVRTIFARSSPDHRFAFHLPAGRYTLVATTGDLAGATFGVPARAGQDGEVDIQLAPTAHIAGTVRAPAEAEIEVKATPVGGAPVGGSQLIEKGAFTLSGLIPGRRYDLTFFGPTLRRSTLRSIAAPTDALEVALAELPIVRGAIGFSDDDSCPVDQVTLHGPGIDEGDPPSSDVGDDCRFELRVPEDTANPTIVATGSGWRLEDSLALPPQGDPDPICLNPPCRSDQLEPPGQPRVVF